MSVRTVGGLAVAGLVLVAANAAAGPDKVIESFYGATGQNIRIASGVDESGEYGVVVGSNVNAAASTPLFAVCEDCNGETPTYVFSVDSDGDISFGLQIVALSTTSTATGLNFSISSGANAAGEYGVVLGTDAAGAANLDLVGFAVDIDGTPIYAAQIATVGSDGTGAIFETTKSASGLNLGIASGANAAGEYGVSLGTNAAAAANLDLAAFGVDLDGTPIYALSVATIAAGGTGARVQNTAAASGQNLVLASGADGAGEYGVVAGTNAILTVSGQPLFAVGADLDGTPVYTLEVQGIQTTGAGAWVANTSSNAAQNLTLFSGANAAGEYAVEVGSSAVVSDGTQLFAVGSDLDGTETYVFTVSADDNVLLGATAPIVSTVSTQAGINLVVASGANAAGEYAVSVGTNAAAAANLDLVAFGVDLDGTPVYAATVSTIAADGTGASIETTASAAGVNMVVASGANAAGEYGVVAGTTAAASASVPLFGIASDVDGTPVYALSVENIAADGSGAAVYNTASAAGVNLSIASGANAAGEYGVTVGSTDPVAAATPLFSVASGIGGAPTHVFTVDSAGNVGGLLAGRTQIHICGDLDTVNNTTLFWGPEKTVAASATIGGLQCDTTQAGNGTEANVDEPVFNAKAFQVLGMICHTVDLGASVVFTLRSAAAGLTPAVTCTVADNELDCVADVQTTTAVASGATFALQAFSSSDMGAATVFQCDIELAY